MGFLDVTSHRFGKLVAVRRAPNTALGQTMWECQCDCGRVTTVNGQRLRAGQIAACGCDKPDPLAFSGRIFGRWTAIEPRDKGRQWLCRCTCGTERVVSASRLRCGATNSCGCLNRERFIGATRTHGATAGGRGAREYITWKSMRTRCLNRNAASYDKYGGRGITIDSAWDSFEQFRGDMGPCPEGLTLERKDVNGPYTKANCVWASRAVQSRNRRVNRRFSLKGETLLMTDWARRLGISPATMHWRLKNWPVERALSTHRSS